MGELIGLIFVAAIMGALARLFMKGEQPIGILWTIILGALGAFVGGLIVPDGIFHWILGIILAMVFIAGYIAIRGRSKTV